MAADPPTLPSPVGALPCIAADTRLNDADQARLVRYFAARHADATRRAYRSDWTLYAAWCDTRGCCALPATPATVAAFLAYEADDGRQVSTIRRRAAAIRLAHRLCDYEPPTNAELVRGTLRGIARTHGAAPHQKAPALAERLRAMVDTLDDTTHQG